jgi:hypothetical protein
MRKESTKKKGDSSLGSGIRKASANQKRHQIKDNAATAISENFPFAVNRFHQDLRPPFVSLVLAMIVEPNV